MSNNSARLLLLLVAILLRSPVFAQSGSITAGQTVGMRVTYPSNLFFHTNNQPPYASQQLDVDGDGNNDFQLYHEISSAISIALIPLSSTEWQVLNTSASNTQSRPLSVSVPYASAVDASSLQAAWGSYGQLRFIIANAGISYPSGAWTEDTVTRYIGIRQFKNNGWRYGYLKTKRMVANNAPSPVFVTAYAIQSLVTGTAQAQLQQVEVYPNPAQSVLRVNYPQKAHLLVYNAVGSRQYEAELDAGTTQVSIANWKAGIYLLRLENKEGVYTTRFQKAE